MSNFMYRDLVAGAFAVGLLGFGLILATAPERVLRRLNTIAQHLGNPTKLWSERCARANAAPYRFAGLGFVALAGFILYDVSRRALPPPQQPPLPAQRTPIVGIAFAFVAAVLFAILAINPRAATQILQWDRYMDPALIQSPHFHWTMRMVGMIGLVFLVVTMLRHHL